MFDPECQNIDCPECNLGNIYFDREIGFYCMLCGREFSAVDMEVLVEKIALTSHPVRKPGSGGRKPAGEIRELPARNVKTQHISRDIVDRKTPEH